MAMVTQLLLHCFFFPSIALVYSLGRAAFAKDTYYLGFLSPVPKPSGEYLIPSQLAQQWQSAFHVAVDVLNAENRPYQLEPVPADSGCNWMKVLTLAEAFGNKDIIGLVGPACSGAAISAANYFDQGIPIVSFAATHELLSDRTNYPNFFRTIYGDRLQTLAILSIMEKLDMWNVTILCTKDYYSLSLASSLQQTAIQRISSMKIVEGGENSSVNADQVVEILSSLQPDDFVILAVPPLVAQDLWTVATKAGKTAYPWWYFGTDGVTAFDPYSDGSSSEVVEALQGEIGLAPYGGGDYTTSFRCQKFFDHWRDKGYPAMPLTGGNKTRSYVTHLIDTVTLFFEIVDSLVNASVPVNATTVLSALKGSGVGSPRFTGCTGPVEIDPQTGSRKIASAQTPTYDLVSLVNDSWELKGRIYNTSLVGLQPITRPVSEAADSGPTGSRSNGGIIAGVVLFSVAFVVLVGIVITYYRRRQRTKPGNFVRM